MHINRLRIEPQRKCLKLNGCVLSKQYFLNWVDKLRSKYYHDHLNQSRDAKHNSMFYHRKKILLQLQHLESPLAHNPKHCSKQQK